MLSLEPTWLKKNADSTDLSFELNMCIMSHAERERKRDRHRQTEREKDRQKQGDREMNVKCLSILSKMQNLKTKIFTGFQGIDSDDL